MSHQDKIEKIRNKLFKALIPHLNKPNHALTRLAVYGLIDHTLQEELLQDTKSICDCSNPFVGAKVDGTRKCGLCHRNIENK